ncbi:MAG: Peptidase sortase-like protein [Parcubacteria group bacterium]|nr:Peptidase sortase-like protein [Parcubacteria group bacterium]
MSSNPHQTANKGPKNVKKLTFFALALVVFGASVMVLSGFDVLPDAELHAANLAARTAPVTTTPKTTTQSTSGTYPDKINIPAINLTATVANPTTTNAEILDKDLLYGAVRYPTSGTLGQANANVVLFGHSSYLPIVHNQAYKTFDGIQNLKHGDQILVSGAGTTYVYEVETIAQANAQTDGIPLTVTGSKLTLVTCDSFATKSDRFVVIAHLVESYPSAS